MTIGSGELDAMLEKASGVPSTAHKQHDLSRVADGVKKFVCKESSHEGAEFPK